MWHRCGKVNSDALESLQHTAAKSDLDTKELNATLGLVPLINSSKLHIVLLTKNQPRQFSFTLHPVTTTVDGVIIFIPRK